MSNTSGTTSEETPRRNRRRLRAVLAIVAALLLALGASACGSDDDGGGGPSGSDSSESEPLSKKDYLEQVNKAQTDFAGQAAKLDLANPSSPKDFKRSLDKLVGLIDRLEARLDGLEPPESVASQHDKLVNGLGDYGEVIEQEKGGLASDDRKEVVDAATEIGNASTKFSTDFNGTIQQINGNLK